MKSMMKNVVAAGLLLVAMVQPSLAGTYPDSLEKRMRRQLGQMSRRRLTQYVTVSPGGVKGYDMLLRGKLYKKAPAVDGFYCVEFRRANNDNKKISKQYVMKDKVKFVGKHPTQQGNVETLDFGNLASASGAQRNRRARSETVQNARRPAFRNAESAVLPSHKASRGRARRASEWNASKVPAKPNLKSEQRDLKAEIRSPLPKTFNKKELADFLKDNKKMISIWNHTKFDSAEATRKIKQDHPRWSDNEVEKRLGKLRRHHLKANQFDSAAVTLKIKKRHPEYSLAEIAEDLAYYRAQHKQLNHNLGASAAQALRFQKSNNFIRGKEHFGKGYFKEGRFGNLSRKVGRAAARAARKKFQIAEPVKERKKASAKGVSFGKIPGANGEASPVASVHEFPRWGARDPGNYKYNRKMPCPYYSYQELMKHLKATMSEYTEEKATAQMKEWGYSFKYLKSKNKTIKDLVEYTIDPKKPDKKFGYNLQTLEKIARLPLEYDDLKEEYGCTSTQIQKYQKWCQENQ